jgi:flagellar motility protein MotE (MotC chaperone)
VIVTRQRRKRFPWRRLLLPIAAIALLTFALSWAPSRNFLANGPLAPAFKAVQPALAPFHFEAQNRTIAEQKNQIDSLQKQASDAKQQIADRDKEITSLTTQLNQLQQQLAAKSSAPAQPTKKPASAATAGANDLSSGATPDMRRTAAQWSAMDPEAVAKVVQRLPVAYVARIFAVMGPDNVGPILEAVPPAYAAQLTRDHPELAR